MLVLLAKLGDARMLGAFALGLATTAPIMMLANLQLRPVLATDLAERYAFGEYFALRFLTTALALVAIAGVVIVAGYKWDLAIATILIGVARSFESISEILHGLLQKHERMDRIGKSMLMKGPLVLAAMAFALYATHTVVWAAAAFALGSLLPLAIYDVRSGIWIQGQTHDSTGLSSRVGLRPIWNPQNLWRIALVAAPLGVTATLSSLNSNVPRYLVDWYRGQRDLGIFAGLGYILIAAGSVSASLGQALTPRLARQFSEGDRRGFTVLLLKALGFGLLLGLGGIALAWFLGQKLLLLMYGPEFSGQSRVFVWVMVAACFWHLGQFVGFGATAARQFHAQIPLLLVVMLGSMIGCMILIPRNGISGAAQGVAIGFLLQTLGGAAICGLALQRSPVRGPLRSC
jgi:O-antigen/teichoic acid export membrane protein